MTIKKELKAGEYSLKYDASNLPTGVYIYSIKSGVFQQSKKMILIK